MVVQWFTILRNTPKSFVKEIVCFYLDHFGIRCLGTWSYALEWSFIMKDRTPISPKLLVRTFRSLTFHIYDRPIKDAIVDSMDSI